MKTYVLAIDIERSGARYEHDTVGIGAVVVDGDLKQLDSLLLKGYVPNETKFEQRCMSEFWSNHPETLEMLTYDGELSKVEREKEMIELLQEFRAKWEGIAEEDGAKLELVTDNNVYNGGYVNKLINDHTEDLPIPYNTQRKYSPFWETHAEQRGLLMAIDSSFEDDWGLYEKINQLYEDLPEIEKTDDHNPVTDAYAIACEQQILLGIRERKYKLKNPRKADVKIMGYLHDRERQVNDLHRQLKVKKDEITKLTEKVRDFERKELDVQPEKICPLKEHRNLAIGTVLAGFIGGLLFFRRN